MTLKKSLSIACFVLFFSLLTSAQYNFQHLIGGTHHDRAQTAFSTFDNNYIVNGATLSYGLGDADAMLIKLDSTGQTIWSYTYGTAAYDNSEYAIEASDHTIVCAGRSNIQTGFPTSAVLFKTDSAGNVMWSKMFGGIANDGLVQVIETSDNGFVFVGNTASLSSGASDVLLIRTDANGDTVFTRAYGTAEAEAGTSVIQLPDNGFLIAGKQVTFPGGGPPEADGLLIRTDASGNILWSKMYGDSLWEELTAVQQTIDGEYIVTGSTVTFGAGDFDILLMKTDSSGDVLWSRTFGGAKSDASYDIHINPDNTLIMSGYTESLGYGHARLLGNDSSNVFLLKTSDTGVLQWMQAYGDGLQDEAFRSGIAADGGYLVTGLTTDYIANDSSQMIVIKTDFNGLTGCHELPVTPIDSDIVMPFSTVTLSQLSGMSFANAGFTRTTVTTNNDDACLIASTSDIATSSSEIIAYPNPFSDEITISSKNISNSDIIIYDISGREVLRTKLFPGETKINTSSLERGIYSVAGIKVIKLN